MRIHRSTLMLTAGHFFIDAYASMLGAFIPFLHSKLHLSLTQAGILGGAMIFSSALMQPAYGYLADRLRHKAVAALGPAVAGVFVCSIGMAPNFLTLLLLVLLGGVGVAAFHPQGAAVATETREGRPGQQMSFFVTGGTLGYAAGPVYITSVITLAGLESSYWAAVPGILMSAFLLIYGPSPQKTGVAVDRTAILASLLAHRRTLMVHYFIVVLRSINHLNLAAFVPLYFAMRGYSDAEGGQFLSLYLLAGGITGFWGGVLADRFGGKWVLSVAVLGYTPVALGFLLTSGGVSIFLCAACGAFLLLANPVNVLMAQKLVPEAASTVSSLMMGFAWGISGAIIPLVGFLGDHFGLQNVLIWLVSITSPAFLLVFLLPAHQEPAAAIRPGLAANAPAATPE